MATLYELTAEMLEILAWAEDEDVDQEAIDGTLEMIGEDLKEKLEGYGAVMADINGRVAGIDAELDRLTKRKKRLVASVDRMMGAIQRSMEATEQLDIQSGTFHFKIKNNPPKVVIDSEGDVPPEFLRIKTEPDKTAIKKLLKDETVTWAHMESSRALKID